MQDPQDVHNPGSDRGLRADEAAGARPAPLRWSDEERVEQLQLTGLVRLSQERDPAAFTQLIRRYERMALSVAFSTLGGAPGDGERAGDVVQEAFVRAWERLGDLKEPERFPSWLCGIARNLVVDANRRIRTRPVADLEKVQAFDRVAEDPLDELDRREQQRLVGEALQELDETSRPVVVMRYYEGLNSREIGERLEIAPAAVDMRLSRARQQLRRKLEARAGQAFAPEARER